MAGLADLTPDDLARLLEMLQQMRAAPAQTAPRAPGFYQPMPPERAAEIEAMDRGFYRPMDPERAAEIARMDPGFIREAPPEDPTMLPMPDSVLQNIARILQRRGR